MAEIDDIRRLKSLLREAVSDFCSRKLLWKRPVLQTIREIRDQHWNAVLFGGTVRSLLLRRELENASGPAISTSLSRIFPIDLLHERFLSLTLFAELGLEDFTSAVNSSL